jgi:hypothetical protein
VASRWNGALEARLRHSPLEAFLRSRRQRWSVAGEARVSDNLATAAIYFVDAAAEFRARGGRPARDAAHRAAIGEATCIVSHALAALILEPASWRIAALVGIARLLAPQVGLDSAAHVAASSARDYQRRVKAGLDADLHPVRAAVAEAVRKNADSALDAAIELLAAQMRLVSAVGRDMPIAPAMGLGAPL